METNLPRCERFLQALRRVSARQGSSSHGYDSLPFALHVAPRPQHTLGLGYLTRLPMSNSFDNVLIVVDHLT
jgi:hypothetical protein